MAKTWYVKEDNGIVRLEMDKPGTQVNVLDTESMKELREQLEAVSKRSDVKALLFTSAKSRIFIAGADINEIKSISTEEEAYEKAEMGKQVFQLIEDLKFPTIAVINGACLGGGYELSLACDYRIASLSPSVRIGLPEVNLGILPGFGGSIRLPRLLGLAKSLPLILGGLMLPPQKAFKLGLVDQLAREEELLPKSLEFAQKAISGQVKPSRRPCLLKTFERIILGPFVVYPAARKNIMKRTKGFYPAPLKALELIQKTYGKDAVSSFREESRAFSELGATPVSKNLIRLFFMSERYKKRAWTDEKEIRDEIKSCGVIGAGVMGGGIAQLVSYKDIPVKIRDISEKALEGARKEAERIYQGAVKKGKVKAGEVTEKMSLIKTGASEDEIGETDIVIEAVVEDMGIKKKVLGQLSEHAKDTTLIVSNTSSLSVSEMAEAVKNPERVAGLHFFNPVHRMPLVEVIRGRQSSPATLERVIQFARRLSKTVIVVEDAPGFLVNRLLLPYLNESAYMMQEGLSPQDIDRVAKKFGMPMGPVELVDQVGVDVGYKVAHILYDAFGERMRVADILEKIKDKGFLGKKTGKGFYVYSEKGKEPNPDTEIGIPLKSTVEVNEREIIQRLIYIMINEAARCLEEKIIDEPATVDIGMIMGTGFPPFRAGLLRFADEVGAANILSVLTELTEKQGKRFAPCELLKKLAQDNAAFYSE